jgi:hypothetical protein
MRKKELPWKSIPDLQLVKTVTKITEIFASSEQVKFATGFFFDYEDEIYLVTNRHVVYNACNEVDVVHGAEPKRPVALRLLLNRKDALTKRNGIQMLDLTKHEEYELSLYDNGSPIWLEHPDNLKFSEEKDKVDIAVIPLNKKEILDRFLITRFEVNSFKPSEFPIFYGESLMVLGYPLGRYDELNNLPIVRSATIATAYSAYYRGRPIFLVDSRLHQGVSGSPVLTNQNIPKFFDGAWQLPKPSGGHLFPMPFLLGIVSSYLTVMDESTREYIGLSEVFHATLIPEIIAHYKKALVA